MKSLFTFTAVIEAATGLSLAVAPSWVAAILLGSSLDSPSGLVIGRVLGAALFALGAACWFSRDLPSPMAKGLLKAMLLYNIAVGSLLVHAGIGLGISGLGLWPAVILHSGLAVWCVAALRSARADVR